MFVLGERSCAIADFKLLGRVILVFDPQKSLIAVKNGKRSSMPFLDYRMSSDSQLVPFLVFFPLWSC